MPDTKTILKTFFFPTVHTTLHLSTHVYAGKGSQAVEAVMKMWPPPAPPTSSAPLGSPAPLAHWGGGAERSSSCMSAQENTAELQLHRKPDAPSTQGIQGPRSSGSILRVEGQCLTRSGAECRDFQLFWGNLLATLGATLYLTMFK